MLTNYNDDLGKFPPTPYNFSHLTSLLYLLSKSIEFVLSISREKSQDQITNDLEVQKPEGSIVMKLGLLKCFPTARIWEARGTIAYDMPQLKSSNKKKNEFSNLCICKQERRTLEI